MIERSNIKSYCKSNMADPKQLLLGYTNHNVTVKNILLGIPQPFSYNRANHQHRRIGVKYKRETWYPGAMRSPITVRSDKEKMGS